MQNKGDNDFQKSLDAALLPLVSGFFETTDYAASSRRAVRADLVKFGRWYIRANNEPFDPKRVTMRDVADFRDSLRRESNQAVATVNRSLVSVRRFFGWLKDAGHVSSSPAVGVKELHKQELAPKGVDRIYIRKLLREAESRQDIRAVAIFNLFLYTGLRVSELCGLGLTDLTIADRSGWALVRHAKGGKQRRVPLPLQARRAMQTYLDCRPPFASTSVFVGERGPLTTRGVRSLFTKYSAIVGVHIHPHALRHSYAKEFLAANANDLVGLASLMGHDNLNTTRRYVQRTSDELHAASENLNF